MTATWRHVSASVAGTSHLRDGRSCQDACACVVLIDDDRRDVLVAAVSDGAGSASHSDLGSGLACTLFVEEIRALLATGGSVADVTLDFGRDWLRSFANEIGVRAEALGVRPRDLACTFLAIVVNEDRAVFLQVGDGAMVFSMDDASDALQVAVWPQNGEYENVTFFATDPGAADHLACHLVEGRIDRVALFSDGLQRLALSYADRSAFPPFFRPLFGALEGARVDVLEKLSDPLADFLASPRVNERTDDDKSIVLASRRSAGDGPEDRPRAAPESVAASDGPGTA